MKFLAVLLLAILAACSPTRVPSTYQWNVEYTHHEQEPKTNMLLIPTWVDKEFGENIPRVISAVNDWNIVLNGKFKFEIQTREVNVAEDDLALIIRKVSVAKRPMPGVLGWWDPNDEQFVNVVDDDPNLPVEMIKTVTLHEIFHWWHMPHLKVQGTIEWPSVQRQPPCLDQYSVITLGMIRGWDPKYLNWCTP